MRKRRRDLEGSQPGADGKRHSVADINDGAERSKSLQKQYSQRFSETGDRWHAGQRRELRDVVPFDASAMLRYPKRFLKHTKTPAMLVVKLHLIMVSTKHHAF